MLERDAAFDVVLCDLQMPEMSGMELTPPSASAIPALAERFIFVTGGAFSSDARRFLEDVGRRRHPEAVPAGGHAGAHRPHRPRRRRARALRPGPPARRA